MAPRRDWAALWNEDAIFTGVLIHGGQLCPTCGVKLPASRDYWPPSKKSANGLHGQCLRCRALRAVKAYRADPEAAARKRRRERERYRKASTREATGGSGGVVAELIGCGEREPQRRGNGLGRGQHNGGADVTDSSTHGACIPGGER